MTEEHYQHTAQRIEGKKHERKEAKTISKEREREILDKKLELARKVFLKRASLYFSCALYTNDILTCYLQPVHIISHYFFTVLVKLTLLT